MAQEWTSKGECAFCGDTFTKRGIGRQPPPILCEECGMPPAVNSPRVGQCGYTGKRY